MIKAAFTVAALKLLRSTTRAVILDPGIFLQAFYGGMQYYTSREDWQGNIKLEIKKIRLQIIEHKLLVLGMCP
ncbi:hypothetical protein ACHWQZ_G019080 [Mnemiopsis leidyi]